MAIKVPDIHYRLGVLSATIPDRTTQDKTLNFIVNQFLEQSSLGGEDQRGLKKLTSNIIENGELDFHEKWRTISDVLADKRPYHAEQFAEFTSWFAEPEGMNLIKKDIQHMTEVKNLSFPVRNYVTNNYLGQDEINALNKKYQGSKWGNKFRINSGQVSEFTLFGQSQTAKTYNAQLTIPGLNNPFQVKLFEPSQQGFIANTTSSVNTLKQPGEGLYAVGKRFVTDVDQAGLPVFANSFEEFQTQLLDQLETKVSSLGAGNKHSPAALEDEVKKLVKTFNETLTSQQYFAGTAPELQNYTTLQGNALAKIVSEQEKLAVVPTFSANPQSFSPGNQTLFRKLNEAGFEFPLSSGQTGNSVESVYGGMVASPKSLSNKMSYDPGYPFPSYREPHKQLGELQPLVALAEAANVPNTNLPRVTNILPGAFQDGASDLTKEVFKPKGLQTIVSFIGNISDEAQPIIINPDLLRKIYPDADDQTILEMTKKINDSMGTSNLALPDGVMIAKDSLARDAGAGYMRSEKIKIRGPGSEGGHYIGQSLDAFLEGKTSTFQIGKEKVDFKVKGFRAAQGDMSAALEIVDISSKDQAIREALQKELNTFGFPLQQGSYIGMDYQGYQVSSDNRANVRGYIRGATASQTGEGLDLRIFQTTEQAYQDGRALNQINKFTGGALNKGRVSANYVTNDQFARITGVVDEAIEGMLPAMRLADPLERTYYQGGAAKYSMNELIGDVVSSSSSPEQQELLSTLKQLETEDILSLVHGRDSKAFTQLEAGEHIKARIRELATGGAPITQPGLPALSTEFRLSNMMLNVAQETGVQHNEAALTSVISNIYAPHTKWGEQRGFDGSAKIFTEWHADAKAKPMNQGSQQILDELAILTERLVDPQKPDEVSRVVDNVINSRTPMKSALVLGLNDEGTMLGMGQKATFEPRIFDVVKNQPYLTQRPEGWMMSPMEEMTSRMTNFIPAIEELNKSITGASAENIIGLADYNKSDLIGRMPVTVDLGIPQEHLAKIEAIIEQQNGAKSYSTLGGKIYMPSEESLTAIGKMRGGLALEKDKPIREIYTELFNNIAEAKRTNAPHEEYAKSFVKFQSELQNMQKVQVMGEAGGGAHGLLRGPVHGSSVVYNLGYSADLQQSLGIIGGAEEKYQGDFFKTQRRSYFQNVSEQGVGRQMFVTERAAKAHFQDAINFTKEQRVSGKLDDLTAKQMIAGLEDNYQRLLSGEGVGTLVSRDPSIQHGSVTGGTMYLDRASNYTKNVEAVQLGQEFATITREGKNPVTVGFSILHEINADHDGDRLKIVAMSRANSEQISQNLVEPSVQQELRSARTMAIKANMVDSTAAIAADLKAQRYAGKTAEEVMGASAQKAVEAQAKASPKTLVPRISNALSEMKFALGLTGESQASDAIETAFNFLYTTEQVPISGKHFAQQAEFGDELVGKFQGIRKNFLDPEKFEQGVDDLMRLMAGDTKGNLLPDLNFEVKFRGETYNEKVSYTGIRDTLVDAGKKLHENDKNVDVLKLLRSKASLEHVDQEELMGVYRQLGSDLEGVHYRAEDLKNLGTQTKQAASNGARQSANTLADINKNIISEGAERASTGASKGAKVLEKMGTKNIAIAAGLVAAAGVGLGITMSPTYVNKREQYIDPEYLFPEEFDKLDPNLHSKGLITPSAVVAQGDYRANIHLPPGARVPENLAGRLAAMGGGISSSLSINDHRMSLDANKIDKIRREIV